MPEWLVLVSAGVLLVVGVRLSAFFSGAETGFYRISFLRLSIDAQGNDRVARRLFWFAQNPSRFVATTLVGNNFANYLITAAIGVGLSALLPQVTNWAEVAATLLFSPVIFVFCELMPKYLYYRAPMQQLRRNVFAFLTFYRLFLVVTLPLIGLTRLLQRYGDPEHHPVSVVLGRKQLAQMLSQGHREGVLSELQSCLAYGLLNTATEQVTTSMTPADRVLGVRSDISREELMDFARRFGLANVVVHKAESPGAWYAYVRLADVSLNGQPPAAHVHPLPAIPPTAAKLEAMLTLRQSGEPYGVVRDDSRILGVVSVRGLVEQLFRPPEMLSRRFPNPR